MEVSNAPRATKEQREMAVKDVPGEVWKDIRGYETIYQVSNLGRVKHLPSTVIEFAESGEIINQRKTAEYILKAAERRSDKYLSVGLTKRGQIHVDCVHRIVARTFCPKLPEETEVHHIDRDRHNNTAANLIWLTPEDHSWIHRTRPCMQRDSVG